MSQPNKDTFKETRKQTLERLTYCLEQLNQETDPNTFEQGLYVLHRTAWRSFLALHEMNSSPEHVQSFCTHRNASLSE
jgi:hypothetical protein